MAGKNGCISLFVSELSNQHSPGEIKSLFQKAIRQVFPECGILFCDLLQITDQDLKRSEYHAMLSVQPAKAALWAVQRLDGTLMDGRRIRVRRYQTRNPLRSASNGDTGESYPNSKERRRSRLMIDLVKSRRRPWLTSFVHWIASSPFSRA